MEVTAQHAHEPIEEPLNGAEPAVTEETAHLGDEAKASLRTEYLEERKRLDESVHKYAESFDKIALAILGGGIALSVTFVKDLSPKPLPFSTLLLTAGWLVMVAGILASMLGLYWCQRAFEDDILDCDERYRAAVEGRKAASPENRFAHRIHKANRFVIGSIFLGVLFVLSFAGVNFVQKAFDPGSPMNPKTSPSPQSTKPDPAPFGGGPSGRPVPHPALTGPSETKGAPPSSRPVPAPTPAPPKPSGK